MLLRALQRVHFVVACLVGGIAFVGTSLFWALYAVVRRSDARRAPVFFARTFAWIMRTVLGWRIDAQGTERLGQGPVVIAVNHQSNLDIVTCGSIYPFGTVVIGKKEIRALPGFGWFFAVTGNLFIDRSDPKKARETMSEAARHVTEEKLSVWMFPEGHRNQAETLLPFKKGAFHMAIEAQVPVVVIVVEPMRCVLLARRWLVRPGTIRIRVQPPIPSAGRTAEDVDTLLEETRTLMQRVRDELAATAGPPIG